MDIYKALKLEEKSNKRFYILMGLIGIVLPFSLWFTGINTIFLDVLLIFIELLIILSILKRIDFMKLKYSYKNNKIRFVSGMFTKEKLIICDKVAVVHTSKMEEDMEIVILSKSNIRKSKVKPIVKGFLLKYPEVSEEYLKLKRMNPEEEYFYQIIKKGGLKKYLFLKEIYSSCVKAVYTESCIQNIKIARGDIL